MLRSGALALLALLAAAAPAAAVPRGFTVVTSGLDRPRGLAFTPDGTLYATLVGHGPVSQYTSKTCNDEGCFGPTGQIVRVFGRTTTPVATGLLSMRGEPDGTFSIGADSLTALPDGRLATAMTSEFTGETATPPTQIPAGLRGQIGRVLTVPSSGGAVTVGPSVSALEFAHDADGEGKVSNPYGIAAVGDALYVSDSAANTLVQIRDGVAKTIAVFPDVSKFAQSVPDALAAGPDGSLYVGEFTGGDNAPGTARIWRVVPGSRPTLFAKGLETITGLAVSARGTVYVSELAPGHVVRIAADGDRFTVATGLHFPAGIAISPVTDRVYVTNHSLMPARSRPGDEGVDKQTGQIVRLG